MPNHVWLGLGQAIDLGPSIAFMAMPCDAPCPFAFNIPRQSATLTPVPPLASRSSQHLIINRVWLGPALARILHARLGL